MVVKILPMIKELEEMREKKMQVEEMEPRGGGNN
jgi:hypothetical protein